MGYDYYCNYGVKVKQEVLESFEEYKVLYDTLKKYDLTFAALAEYCTRDDSYIIDEQVNEYNISNLESNPAFEQVSSEDVANELEDKLNDLLKAFARRYRGYGLDLMYIDSDEIYSSHGLGNNYYVFYITNEYKENVFKIGDRFDYVGGY